MISQKAASKDRRRRAKHANSKARIAARIAAGDAASDAAAAASTSAARVAADTTATVDNALRQISHHKREVKRRVLSLLNVKGTALLCSAFATLRAHSACITAATNAVTIAVASAAAVEAVVVEALALSAAAKPAKPKPPLMTNALEMLYVQAQMLEDARKFEEAQEKWEAIAARESDPPLRRKGAI
jgi:hypothetical protein